MIYPPSSPSLSVLEFESRPFRLAQTSSQPPPACSPAALQPASLQPARLQGLGWSIVSLGGGMSVATVRHRPPQAATGRHRAANFLALEPPTGHPVGLVTLAKEHSRLHKSSISHLPGHLNTPSHTKWHQLLSGRAPDHSRTTKMKAQKHGRHQNGDLRHPPCSP